MGGRIDALLARLEEALELVLCLPAARVIREDRLAEETSEAAVQHEALPLLRGNFVTC